MSVAVPLRSSGVAAPGGPRTTALRRLLAAAALVWAALVAATALVVALDGPAPPVSAVALPGLLLAPAAALAARSAPVRRRAGGVLVLTGLLAAVVAAVLLAATAAVLVLGRLPDRDESAVLLAGLVGAAVAAAAAVPLVRAARQLAPTSAPEEALRVLSDRSRGGAPLEDVLLQLATSLRRRLALSSVEIWTGDESGLDRLLALPGGQGPATLTEPQALARVAVAGGGWARTWLPALLAGREDRVLRLAPATYDGALLGLVVVTRPRDAPPFDDAEERALLEVGGRLGALLHSRRLDAALQSTLDDLHRTNAELRASRSRLVATADAERRRLERDLHDGAQQHLVAMAVNLGLAADLLSSDPDAARELVEQTREDARAAVGQLRDLAHGIYPPLLLESGLGAALRSLPRRFPGQLRVDAPVSRCAPAVEAALYFCCLEALQNAAKHAPGAPVQITAADEGTGVRVEVVDAGPGLSPGATDGQGVQNTVDRMGAVGGTASWSNVPEGGTRVTLVVPDAGRP